jgi:Ca2+-binding EF-hand superfamily protein
MKTMRMMVAGAAAALLITGCATMDDTAASHDFTKLCVAVDKNNDGKIDMNEFTAGAKDQEQASQVFRQCDLNSDGAITQEEAQKNRNLMRQELMKREVIRITGPR